jgi:hypothetical protein
MKILLRFFLLYAIAFMLVLTNVFSFGQNQHTTLQPTLRSQETANWCWAASGRMIMEFLGHNVAECTEANTYFSRSDCCKITLCPNPAAPTYDSAGNCIGCACGGWPQFDKFGFTFSRTSSAALSWNQLVSQIQSGKPVAFSWRWVCSKPPCGGHMLVARGIQTVNGSNYVEILDPEPVCTGGTRTITYDEYVQRSGDHTHWDDFYNITASSAPPKKPTYADCLKGCSKDCGGADIHGVGDKQACVAQNKECQQRCSKYH